MESKEIIIKEADELMTALRESISKIVVIRLEIMKAGKWLNQQGSDLEVVAEEIEEAVDALYHVETAIGNAHQNLLVSQQTLIYDKNWK